MRLSILTTTIVVEIGIDTARFDKLQSRTKAGKVEQLNSFIRPFKTLYIYIQKRLLALFLNTPSPPYSMLGQIRIITHKNKFTFVQHWFRGRGEQGEGRWKVITFSTLLTMIVAVTVKELCGFNKETRFDVNVPSLALQLGHSIKQCAQVLKISALRKYKRWGCYKRMPALHWPLWAGVDHQN